MSKQIVHKWDSVSQFSRYLAKTPTSGVFKSKDDLLSRSDDYDFHHTYSWDEADNLLRTGDREFFKKMTAREKMRGMKGTGIASKPQYFTDVCGFVPHVPNYVMGLPNNMINKKVVRYKSSKVVTVMYNPSVHCGIKTDEMIDAAIKVMDFVLSLEREGYKVNLYIIQGSSKGNESITNIVRIKASEDYTDKLKLAYPMINPSMFRRHFVRCMEVSGLTNKDFVDGYGRPLMDKTETEKQLKMNNVKYDYLFTFNSLPTTTK